jgi:hypothetical protein
MEKLNENELKTMISGIIHYCIEDEFIDDEDTIWEIVCDETETDYDDYDGKIGMVFEEIIKEWDL